MSLSLGYYTDGGPYRANNQDAFCLRVAPTPLGAAAMAVVCDGMGGLENGEFASAAAVQTFSAWFDKFLEKPTPQTLCHEEVAAQWKELVQTLHKSISRYSAQRNIRTGTTLSAIMMFARQYTFVHIGDTRIYLTDPTHTGLITQDQNLAMREMQAGRLAPENYASDSRRSVLLQCLGTGEVEPVVQSGFLPVTGGVLLCSDGFHGVQNLQALNSCMQVGDEDFQVSLQALGEFARDRGEQDNITVASIRWKGLADWQSDTCGSRTLVVPDANTLDTLSQLNPRPQPETFTGTVVLGAAGVSATVPLSDVAEPRTQMLSGSEREEVTVALDATAPLNATLPLNAASEATVALTGAAEGATEPLAPAEATAPLAAAEATAPLSAMDATAPLGAAVSMDATAPLGAAPMDATAPLSAAPRPATTCLNATEPACAPAAAPSVGATSVLQTPAQPVQQPVQQPAQPQPVQQPQPQPYAGPHNGNGLIPDEICGDDLINIRPLNATGGFSNLFLGHKQGLDVDVVIKRVKKNLQGVVNEQSEAKIMTALRHQYLPRVYDLKTASDGFTYTIMEFIEGCTLKEYVRKRGSLNQQQVLKWTRQLCEVVDYMHNDAPKSIIHSDLKPENVMITPHGDICVIDFNASLEVSDGDQDAIGATAGFAAPEQYNLPLSRFPKNHPLYKQVKAAQNMGHVSFRTDIYAIGALAYFMVTGYAPKSWDEGVVPLERYAITLGDAFRKTIQKAMQPKQHHRYQSAAEMLKALNSLNRIDKRYRRWVAQCRWAGLLVGLGLMASIFCIFVGWKQLGDTSSSEYMQLVLQAQQLRQQGDFDGCRQTLLEAVSMDDNRIEAYLELASLLYQLGEYQQALNLLELEEYDQSPNMKDDVFDSSQGQLAYIKGNCYFQLQQYNDALQSYQLAVSYCPNESLFLRELAIAYAKTGNPTNAQQTLSQMEQAGAPAVDVALVTGEIRYAYGEYIQAYQHLLQAAEAATDAVLKNRCYTMAAKCCQQLGGEQWQDTEISMLKNASAALGTENSGVLQLLAEAWLRKGSAAGADTVACYTEALTCLQQLMDRGMQPFEVRLNTANVLYYLDRYDEAIPIYTALQADFPKDYRIPMHLAWLYLDQQTELPTEQRDYTQFGAVYNQADTLYAAAGTQDSEMLRLQQLAKQLQDAGWKW